MIDNFGSRLKYYRTKELLSQQELAQKSGVSRKQISDFEMNVQTNPREITVYKLATALNISVDYLLMQKDTIHEDGKEALDLEIAPHIYDKVVELAKKNKRTVNDEVTIMLEKAIDAEYDLIVQLQKTQQLVSEMAKELKEANSKNSLEMFKGIEEFSDKNN